MEKIDDGVREQFADDVPNPEGAVSQNDAPLGVVESATMCLPVDSLSEGRLPVSGGAAISFHEPAR